VLRHADAFFCSPLRVLLVQAGAASAPESGAGAAQKANGQVFALKFTLRGHSRAVSAIKYRCVMCCSEGGDRVR
jgi:hypothetical protein